MNYQEKNDPRNSGYTHFRFDCAMFVERRGWTPLFTTGTQHFALALAKMYAEKHPGVQLVIDDIHNQKFIYVPEMDPPLEDPYGWYPATEVSASAYDPAKAPKKEEPTSHVEHHRHRRHKEEEQPVEVMPLDTPIKEVALALYKVVSDKPMTARKICEKAGVDYDNDKRIKMLFKKLRDAGKIRFDTGRWTRNEKT